MRKDVTCLLLVSIIAFIFSGVSYVMEYYSPPTPWIRADQKKIISVKNADFLNDFTISTWVKAPVPSGQEKEIEIFRLSGDQDGYRLVYLSTFDPNQQHRSLHFGVATPNGQWGRVLPFNEVVLADGKWHHIAAIGINMQSYRQEHLSLFIDGKQVKLWQIDSGALLSHPETFFIGQSETLEIKNTEFYLSALSPRQIKLLSLSQNFPPWKGSHLIFLLCILFSLILFIVGYCILTRAHFIHRKILKITYHSFILLILFLGLYFSAKEDFFGISGRDVDAGKEYFIYFQRDSESLVLSGIVEKLQSNLEKKSLTSYGTGELNYDFKPYEFSLNRKPYLFQSQLFLEKPYKSNAGFQSTIFLNKITKKILSYYNNYMFCFFQIMSCILYSIVLIMLIFLFSRQFSIRFSLGMYIGFLFSIWLTRFAKNLYWVPWTWYLPMIFVLLNNHLKTSNWIRKTSLFISVLISVLLKSLCGYEYITCIILSAAACSTLAPFDPSPKSYVPIVKQYIFICLAGVSGFLIAVLSQARVKSESNLIDGLKYIYENDIERQVIGSSTIFFPDVFRYQLSTPIFQNIALYTEHQSFSPGVTFQMLLIIFLYFIKQNFELSTLTTKIPRFVLLNFVSSISWIIIARGHSAGNSHMNYVVWSIMFGPALFGWIAWRYLPDRILGISRDNIV